MKRILILALALVCVFSMLVSCDSCSGTPKCVTCVDGNGDGNCDNCGTPMQSSGNGGNGDNGGNGGNGGDNALATFAGAVADSAPEEIVSEIEVTTADGTSIGATITYSAGEVSINADYFVTIDGVSIPQSSYIKKGDKFKKFADDNPIDLSALNFSEEFFESYAIEDDGEVFTAVVTDPTGFFGTAIAAKKVNVEISLRKGEVEEMIITYSLNGAQVEIVTTFD